MKSLAGVIALLLLGATANARFGQSPLAEVFANSDRVVAASITSARVVPLPAGRQEGSCGYIYEAKVTETFKGAHTVAIRFASNEQMTPDSRHLLFLRNDDKDFPSDQNVLVVDPKTHEEFDPRAGCAKVLPRLKSNWLHTAELQNRRARLSYWIEPPAELQAVKEPADPSRAGGGLQISFVDWTALRSWLLRRAN